ncbi:hypothetical protein V8E53_013881 [Lactarius tabidus]
MGINILPDNVFLEIFDFDRISGCLSKHSYHVWDWERLAHVCRKWRLIIFSSPLRLKLRIHCTNGHPVRKNLGIWPPIPITMCYSGWGMLSDDEDNMIAALKHPDRLYHVDLSSMSKLQFENIAMVMQEPAPMLERLLIFSQDWNLPVLPAGFLGGSAPCLQEILLRGVPFPALPTLLLSASNLVRLSLGDMPLTGGISPKVVVPHLAVLPRLKTLNIEFPNFISHSDQILPLSITRTVLPSLRELSVSGICEYTEDFVARIDTPQLTAAFGFFDDQDVDIEASQLSAFFNRSENLKKILPKTCQADLLDEMIDFRTVGGAMATARTGSDDGIGVAIGCIGMDRQILHLTHVLSCISPFIPEMVHFYLKTEFTPLYEEVPAANEWLQLLRLFTSLRTLFVSSIMAGPVSRALEDAAGVMDTAVLPTLDLLCLEGRSASSVRRFIAFRSDSDHSVTFVNTSTDFEQRLNNYK